MSDTDDRGSTYAQQLLAAKVDRIALAYIGLTDEQCADPALRRLVQKAWADGYRAAYKDEMKRARQQMMKEGGK